MVAVLVGVAGQCEKCDRCDALMRNPEFVFRRMWGAEPWRNWPRPFNIEDSCFARVRDHHNQHQDAYMYFEETSQGKHCHTNWYEGNVGELGWANRIHNFALKAPALLGFDETIDHYCNGHGGRGGHAQSCVNANL